VLLGNPSWVDQMKGLLADRPTERDVPARRFFAVRPTLMDVVDAVCVAFETEKADLSATRRRGHDARMAAVYLAPECAGLPVTQLAHDFGEVSAPAISKLPRKVALRRHEERQRERALGKPEQSLRSAVPKSKVKT
jgi:hypothetical protein